jgi:hypothetical protein
MEETHLWSQKKKARTKKQQGLPKGLYTCYVFGKNDAHLNRIIDEG